MKQILCIKLVKYLDKYTEMHGQENVKTLAVLMEKISYYKNNANDCYKASNLHVTFQFILAF